MTRAISWTRGVPPKRSTRPSSSAGRPIWPGSTGNCPRPRATTRCSSTASRTISARRSSTFRASASELTRSCDELRVALADAPVPAEVRERTLGIVDRDVAESIRYIRTAVTRAAGIIDALLRLSRAGRVEYHVRPVELATTVATVLDAMRTTIAERGARVEVRPLGTIYGDPTAVEQIVANLLHNALSYLDASREGRDRDWHDRSRAADGRRAAARRLGGRAATSCTCATTARAFRSRTCPRSSSRSSACSRQRCRARVSGSRSSGAWWSGTTAPSGSSRPRAGLDLLRRVARRGARTSIRGRRGRGGRGGIDENGAAVVAETIRILLAEDDDGHATLVERNLRRAGLANPVVAVPRRPGDARPPAGRRGVRRSATATASCCSTSTCRAWTASRCCAASRPTAARRRSRPSC